MRYLLRRAGRRAGWFILCAALLLLVLAIAMDFAIASEWHTAPVTVPTLAATAIVILLYTAVTARIHETSRDNTAMFCLAQIHNVMSSDTACERRSVLHELCEHVWNTLRTTPGAQDADYSDRKELANLLHPSEVPQLLSSLKKMSDAAMNPRDHVALLGAFHRTLSAKALTLASGRPIDVREALERTLFAMDIITLPYAYYVSQAERALMAYGPVFDRTAGFLLRFVAMEMYLRRQREYKYHYLLCLQTLGERGALSLDKPSKRYLQAVLEVVASPPAETHVRPLTEWGPLSPIRLGTYRSELDARRLPEGPWVVAVGAHASKVLCALDAMWKSGEIKRGGHAGREGAGQAIRA